MEVGRLQSFGDALLHLKKSVSEISGVLDTIRESTEALEKGHPAKDLINEIQRKYSDCSSMLSDRMTEIDLHFRRMDNFSNRLHHEVVSCRMRPFGDGSQGFPRRVRDVSKKLGKKVRLEIIGKDTDVDRDMLDKLEAPLTHLLRNAIDHGIEYPEQRKAAGKPETGTIRLIARHWAGMLYITVSDDGKGIDIEQLREKVVKRNLVNETMAKTLSDVELIEFMFLPGFSTASAVTEISGWGAGLEADTLPVVVIGDRLNQFGIVVDRFMGEKELVINPLDPRLGKVPDINATALLEDGSPVLLIDVEDMVRSIDNLLNGGWLQRVGLGAKKDYKLATPD